MGLSPDELAALYAGYDREQLEQAVAAGPLPFTREAWVAVCAECEKRGIAWDRPQDIAVRPATPPVATSLAAKRCREAAIACGIPVVLGALGAGYLIFSDRNFIRYETGLFAVIVLVFGLLFLVVKKMWDGSVGALWTMGSLQAIVILFATRAFTTASPADDLFVVVLFAVPLGLEILVVRALMALREERGAGTA